VQQGKLRALAVTGPKRARVLPEVPTLRESGLAGIEVYGWNGILAPAKIPPEIALKVNTAVNAVVATQAVEQRLRTLGYEPYSLPLAEAPAFLKESIDAWARMIREAGITGE
jgi:tripartite-type tricarboxylate transporter receptor subunit TctC